MSEHDNTEARLARVSVITGASSGIGRATAMHLAARGDHVVLAARRADELARTLELCGGRGRVIVCDVARPADIRALAASVAAVEGRCDVLVANAGIGSRAAFDGPDALADLDRIIDCNLRGVAGCIAELLPLLSQSPRAAIVTVSSVAGFASTPTAPAYCASKFALTGLTESLAPTFAKRGIVMSCVQPGPVPTPGWPHDKLMTSRIGRLFAADVDDVARVIVRCTTRRKPSFPVIPRVYRLVHILKVLCPPLWRAAQGRVRHTSTESAKVPT